MKQKMMALLTMLLAGAIMVTGCSSTTGGESGISSTVPVQPATFNAESTTSLSGKLTLDGSISVAKVRQALGEGLMEKYPQVTVEKGGTGSGDAVKVVNNGTALTDDLSHSLKDEERPADFEIVKMAIDGIAITTNPENRVDALTSKQVAEIYTGEISNWKNVGDVDQKITVTGREAASGTRDDFESILNIKEKIKLSAEFSSTGEVISKVSNNPVAIGYVSLDSVNRPVKAVTADGVKPSEETIKDGIYKLQRLFIEIYKEDSDNGLVKAQFEPIDSGEGQQIIRDAGLVIRQMTNPD